MRRAIDPLFFLADWESTPLSPVLRMPAIGHQRILALGTERLFWCDKLIVSRMRDFMLVANLPSVVMSYFSFAKALTVWQRMRIYLTDGRANLKKVFSQ
jgi:hypothetical protein